MERDEAEVNDWFVSYEVLDAADKSPGIEPPACPIADQEAAEKHFRSVAYWRKRLAQVEAHAAQEREIVDRWLERETAQIRRRLQWHEMGLAGFLCGLGEKSWNGIYGTVKKVIGRERIEVRDAASFIGWARTAAPSLCRIKVVEDPDKKAILEYVHKSGEQPPGVEMVRGEDTYKVEVPE